MATIEDITEKKKTESLLLRSQRLDSVGRLASGIAHDLNNILAPILMSAPMLHEITADPNAIKMLDIIESSAQRGADIIKQLLILCLSVADTGQGIAPEHLDKIYDPFFTTKEPGKGTGLGLSTVLGIIKSHGGFIQVQSQLGRGTQFQVFLPASQAAETEPAKPAPRSRLQGRGELVLVVDDEAGVREVSRQILEHGGYRVLEAANGSEGLAQFVARQPDVQVVLTDLAMPTMDGAAFIRALRRLSPRVRVITVSGHEFKAPLLDDLAMLGYTHLSKPFSAAALLEALQRVLHPE